MISPRLARISLLLSLLFPAGFAVGGEVPVTLAETPQIYKNEATAASVEPDSGGSGVRMNYDFESGGDTVRYEFALTPPVEEHVSRILVTAKGKEGPSFLVVRDATKQSIAYKFGPVTENEQIFVIDLSTPAFPGAAKKDVQFPITALGFTLKKPADPKGFFEISKITAETSE